jgi:hypothetical protein
VISEAGTVIDAKSIDGCVEVAAPDVLITRSKVTCTDTLLRVRSGDLTVEDSELDGQRTAITTIGGDYTLRRVNIHNVNEGPRLDSNVRIEDSWVHHLVLTNPDDHQDILQTTGGTNIVIRHNTLQAYNPDEDETHNAAFMVGSEFAPLRDVLVEENLMSGGGCTVNIRPDTDASNVRFRNNTFVDDSYYGCPVLEPDVAGVAWESTNVWQETGRPVV